MRPVSKRLPWVLPCETLTLAGATVCGTSLRDVEHTGQDIQITVDFVSKLGRDFIVKMQHFAGISIIGFCNPIFCHVNHIYLVYSKYKIYCLWILQKRLDHFDLFDL